MKKIFLAFLTIITGFCATAQKDNYSDCGTTAYVNAGATTKDGLSMKKLYRDDLEKDSPLYVGGVSVGYKIADYCVTKDSLLLYTIDMANGYESYGDFSLRLKRDRYYIDIDAVMPSYPFMSHIYRHNVVIGAEFFGKIILSNKEYVDEIDRIINEYNESRASESAKQ